MKTATILLGIMLTIGTSGAALAADDSNAKAAEKLLNSLGMQKTLDAAVAQKVDNQIKQKLELSPYKDAMTRFYAKYMSYDNLKPDLIKMYTQTFSKQEMDEIAAFYDTPTGKKVVAKMPEIINKGVKLGADRAETNFGEMVTMIKSSTIQGHGGM
jgi:uncharacterized protein